MVSPNVIESLLTGYPDTMIETLNSLDNVRLLPPTSTSLEIEQAKDSSPIIHIIGLQPRLGFIRKTGEDNDRREQSGIEIGFQYGHKDSKYRYLGIDKRATSGDATLFAVFQQIYSRNPCDPIESDVWLVRLDDLIDKSSQLYAYVDLVDF